MGCHWCESSAVLSSDEFGKRIVFFFFSSRRRHTRSDRDWSSDVCSSDLLAVQRHDRCAACVIPVQRRPPGGSDAPRKGRTSRASHHHFKTTVYRDQREGDRKSVV